MKLKPPKKLPLSDSPEHQSCRRLSIEDVPPIPEYAVVEVQRRSVVHDLGRQRWRTSLKVDGKILVYIQYRSQPEINNGAHPWLELYSSGDL